MKYLLEFKQHKCNSICVLILNENNEILILKRGSTAPWYPNKWSLVGGMVDKGENEKTAATREVKEETNLTIYKDKLTIIDEIKNKSYTLTAYQTKIMNPKVTLDWENTKYKWVNEDNYEKYDYIPNVKGYIQKCLKEFNIYKKEFSKV